MKYASVLVALVVLLSCVFLDYYLGFVPIPDSPGAWRRAASSLRSVRNGQEEADCFSRMCKSLHHLQIRMFNRGGKEIDVRSQPIDWGSIQTVEIQWRDTVARHDLVDKNNLSILMGE